MDIIYRYYPATDPGSSHYQVEAAVLVQIHHLQILAQDGVGLAAVWPMEIGAFGIKILMQCVLPRGDNVGWVQITGILLLLIHLIVRAAQL